ncbi:uncharacterized protein SAPINGB_P001726 [Magnusiomyces paraingens]|uniref:Chromatin modification-related protein EAF7 n=1 Tax=Magnusiomyces paraingens TaxID=2606893 RepID=A0A5E8B7D5_9ASCO|nr:uncharacterized protein SAPINGB_P001726 [Saprochaete ingens]VVT47468.1 unnamed protein product [Saprochaete ingens]
MVNNPSITPASSLLSIKDIWQKLATLYDLDGLDELEDSSSFMAEEEKLSEESSSVPYFGSLGGELGDGSYLQDFYLPWDDFSNLIIERAVSNESESSDENEGQRSENENASSEEVHRNSSKKRRRSQSSESQPHVSEASEIENDGMHFLFELISEVIF